jgi:hypothetical protein
MHGDWTDLFKHHLEFDGTHFTPNSDEPPVRPQIVTTVTILVCAAMSDFLTTYGDQQVATAFQQAFTENADKTRRLVELHEDFLASQAPQA